MTSIAEPAAKRRKVGQTLDLDYVAIAKVGQDVKLTKDEAIQVEDLWDSTVPILLKDTKLAHGKIYGRFCSLARKISVDVPFVRHTSKEDPVGEALSYCRGLESVHKCKQGRLPLVCCGITLTPRQDLGSRQRWYYLEVRILWQNSAEARENVSAKHLTVLYNYIRSENPEERPRELPQRWSPRDFYENVHVPDSRPEASAKIVNETLMCQLYPFQHRAVQWLLSCEGIELGSDGRIYSKDRNTTSLPPSFFTSCDADGQPIHVSQLLGCVSTSLENIQVAYPKVQGGILAEEMGLGKTVELIALICSHRRYHSHQSQDVESNTFIRNTSKLEKSRATLIITPPSILEQWKEELKTHAPGLKVFHYDGLTATERRSDSEVALDLANNDVVLTTYHVLAREIHYVREKPDRKLRARVRYEPPKCPLVEISWWRVCLDEAQMVESGVSQAAQVARAIPRVNAWAISGTPLRAGHQDLWGLFYFLRLEPFCQSLRVWNRLLGFYKSLFQRTLGTTTIRHSKNLVRDDLRLPSQARHTITVPFTAIEQQHYDQLFQEMCEDVGVDRSGGPLGEAWDPNNSLVIENMRSWLNRLRQTCLHPEIGMRNRRALGRAAGPLRSVMQVLEVMIDQNEGAIRTEQRLVLQSQLHRGQMFEHAQDPQRAIELWTAAYDRATGIVSECRQLLTTAAEQSKPRENYPEEPLKEQQDNEEDEDVDTRLGAFKQRLRSALEVLHMAIFFLGNAYFQMKTKGDVDPSSPIYKEWESQEEAAFEEAKQIRAELLSDIFRKTARLMSTIKKRATAASFTKLPDVHIILEHGGIESREIFEKLHSFGEAMNAQAAQHGKWRNLMAEFLQQPLIDSEDGSIELSGEEYEASTKHQDEMYVYMEALRAVLADRNDALTGQTNFLIAHEMKVALKTARDRGGPAPKLFIEVLIQRQKLRVTAEVGSLRGLISELRQLMTALEWQEGNGSKRAGVELSMVANALKHAQTVSIAQHKALASGIEKEVELFRDAMNSRLEYYRGLQKISDTVAAYEPAGCELGGPLNTEEYERCIEDEARRKAKLSVLLAKHRYLAHLKTEQSTSGAQRLCVICQSPFDQGTLTVCGHVYCRDCILLWWNHHRSCPTCKRPLKASDFHDITSKPQGLVVQQETEAELQSRASSSSTISGRAGYQMREDKIYSDIGTTTLNNIQNIDLQRGSYFGTKVDTMCRHVLWLRERDPGSKAIFFSQYREFLDVLGAAMNKNQISFSRVDAKGGIEKFKKSPTIECFLLHAKAHSAGLNLVNANHVFLCEPLINTALELQAIARVHRIGQHRETNVWMYVVGGTVEESIYEVSVTRRLAHLNRGAARGQGATGSKSYSESGSQTDVTEGIIDTANSLELQSADLGKLLTPGTSGGERVSSDDLWSCLFGGSNQANQGSSATLGEAEIEVGRHLRAEAAEQRRQDQTAE